MLFAPTRFIRVDRSGVAVEALSVVDARVALGELHVKKGEYEESGRQTFARYKVEMDHPAADRRAIQASLDQEMAPIEATISLIVRAISRLEDMLCAAIATERVADDAPSPVGGARAGVPPKDAWEDWSDELYAQAARELRVDLRITYRDAEGQLTHRTITVERYSRTSANGGVLAAFCHLRQSRRPFRFSRILHAADLAEGRRIESLGDWLDARYVSTPLGKRDEFITEHAAALGALFFVAKADGVFRATKRTAMRDFCEGEGLSDDEVCHLVIESVAGWPVPSRIAYGNDLRTLRERSEGYRDRVISSARAMLALKKTVRDAETAALERMRRELDRLRS